MYVYFWQVDLCIIFTLILERCPCNWVQIYWLTFQTGVIWHWNSIVHISSIPQNIRLDEDILKTSFVFVFKRLYQDEHIHLSHTSSEDVFKTSWSRPLYSSWSYVFKTSWSRPIYSRRFQDVFKTSSSYLQDLLQKRLQNVFYTFLRPTARTVIYRRIFLGYTSETFMVSVQNLLTDAYLEPSPTSTMDFFAKILHNFKLLTPSLAKKTP